MTYIEEPKPFINQAARIKALTEQARIDFLTERPSKLYKWLLSHLEWVATGLRETKYPYTFDGDDFLIKDAVIRRLREDGFTVEDPISIERTIVISWQ